MTAGARRMAGGAIDWAEVRRRIDDTRERTRESFRLTPEEAQRVLAERARELARAERVGRAASTTEVMQFVIAGQRYAIETRAILEVFRAQELAFLPGAAPPVVGLVAWRGRLLTVIELRAALGATMDAVEARRHIIVLGEEGTPLGVLADDVDEIATLEPGEIRSPDAEIRVNERYVRGIARDAVLVLEASELLRIDEDTEPDET